MICAFIVMKCEGFTMVSELVDYLNNNLLIAHYCGFDVLRHFPSYWTFDRFLRSFGHDLLSRIMQTQVLSLADKGYDVKEIYNQVKALYDGDYIIPLDKQNTQKPKLLPLGRSCHVERR